MSINEEQLRKLRTHLNIIRQLAGNAEKSARSHADQFLYSRITTNAIGALSVLPPERVQPRRARGPAPVAALRQTSRKGGAA